MRVGLCHVTGMSSWMCGCCVAALVCRACLGVLCELCCTSSPLLELQSFIVVIELIFIHHLSLMLFLPVTSTTMNMSQQMHFLAPNIYIIYVYQTINLGRPGELFWLR